MQPKKRTFKKFSFRGVDLDALLDMGSDELVDLFHARARRRLDFLVLPSILRDLPWASLLCKSLNCSSLA